MSNPTDKDELRKVLVRVLNMNPDTSSITYDLDEAEKTILTLFDHYANQRVKEARIDELDKLMSTKILEHAWIPELDRYYNDRLATLKESKDE